jgi:hypothetical protein
MVGWLPRSRRSWKLAGTAVVVMFVLWPLTGYYRGMLMAHVDHACGHYEIKTYGLHFFFDGPDEDGRPLKEQYGVKVNFVAGCGASEPFVWYVKGYNATSRRMLFEKHGKDVFQECYPQFARPTPRK